MKYKFLIFILLFILLLIITYFLSNYNTNKQKEHFQSSFSSLDNNNVKFFPEIGLGKPIWSLEK